MPPRHPVVELAAGDRICLRRDGVGTVLAVNRGTGRLPVSGPRTWSHLGPGIVVELDSGLRTYIREPQYEVIAKVSAAGVPPEPESS